MRIGRRAKAAGLLAVLTLLSAGCIGAPQEQQDHFYDYGINPAELPESPAEADFLPFLFGHADRIAEFAGKDLSGKDLRRLSPAFLAALTFDNNTVWPAADRLPPGFAPADWLEAARNPGLGVRNLHRQGITGEGVAVAVFDKPLRATHSEFAGRLHYQTVDPKHPKNSVHHFHGIACAAILAGETTGVAPEAEIYYFAVPDAGKNFIYYSRAVDVLVALNATLPPERKVRLISISDGLSPEDAAWGTWMEALVRAELAGIAVLWSNCAELTSFCWGGCPPDRDRDDPGNYRLAGVIEMAPPGAVIVPGDYRTTAGNGGDDIYVYWGEGGFSWAIPYVAGLAVLAWQVDPEIGLSEIIRLLMETAVVKGDGTRIPDPAAFIAAAGGQ